MSERPTLSVVEERAVEAKDAQQEQANPSVDEADERIAHLGDRLAEAIALELEMTQHLADHRSRTADLADRLRHAREEAAAAAVAEADQRREAILAEAEAARTAALRDAEREATQITRQAFAKSRSIVTAAEEEAASVLDARQRELAGLEADATQRLQALMAEEDELLGRIEVAKKIYEELQETLQAVAQASINELATAKSALAEMQPLRSTTPRRRNDDQ